MIINLGRMNFGWTLAIASTAAITTLVMTRDTTVRTPQAVAATSTLASMPASSWLPNPPAGAPPAAAKPEIKTVVKTIVKKVAAKPRPRGRPADPVRVLMVYGCGC